MKKSPKGDSSSFSRYTVYMQTKSKSKLLTLVASRTMLALFIAYVLLNLGRAIRTNYHTSKQIHELKQQIALSTTQTVFLKNELVYYKSRSYQELEAKRRLGLKRPGETVVLVPSNADPATQQPIASPIQDQPIDDHRSFFDEASVNASTWTAWITTPFHE